MKRPIKPYSADIRLIIWDLDGPLIPFNEEYRTALWRAVRKMSEFAAEHWVPADLDEREKIKMAVSLVKSIAKGRDIGNFSKEYNLATENGAPLTSRELYAQFQRYLASELSEIEPEMRAALSQHGVRQVVLTHSHGENWTLRAMVRAGIRDLFDNDSIFSLDMVGIKKSHGEGAFQYVLDKINEGRHGKDKIRADQTIVVEDRRKNLKYPPKMGMHTVLIQPSGFWQSLATSLMNQEAPYGHADAHHVCKTSLQFLEDFMRSRNTALSDVLQSRRSTPAR